MKYEKGTFMVVPNKNHLRGKPSEMQSIYFWLCDHINDDGNCFPSRTKIAKEAGCGIRTVDKYLKQLVEEGFVEITLRKKSGTQENMSSLYQVMLLNALPSVKKNTTPSVKKDIVTVPSINSTHLTTNTPTVAPPFSFQEELEKLQTSSWKPNKIIALYFSKKGFQFQNRAQWKSEYNRNLRPSKDLEGYSGAQIDRVMNYLEESSQGKYEWKLETVVKNIALTLSGKI